MYFKQQNTNLLKNSKRIYVFKLEIDYVPIIKSLKIMPKEYVVENKQLQK